MALLRLCKIVSVCFVAAFTLSGCGANYVAANKDLGIPAGKAPAIGVIVASFVVNTESNPLGPLMGARYGEDIVQNLKVEGIAAKMVKFSDIEKRKQLAAAISKYNSITDYRKRVSEGFSFGDMEKDFADLEIDLLVIISGSAGNPSIPAWAQVSTLLAFGSMSMVTPSTDTVVTSVTKTGKPIYNERTGFTRMGRRDFGLESHRQAMAAAIADDIRKNSF